MNCRCSQCEILAHRGKPWPKGFIPGRMTICDTCGSHECQRARFHGYPCENDSRTAGA